MLGRLLAQTRRPDAILLVDNGTDTETPKLCAAANVRHVRSAANIGGAGGFALACLLALADGADFVWLWDDDGWPDQDDALSTMIEVQKAHRLALLGPLVLDAADVTRAAFAFRFAGRAVTDAAKLRETPLLHGVAHLFNGVLLPAATLHRFGVPDMRFFIRGDEVEFFWRIRRGGGAVATTTRATARHPSGLREAKWILGGRAFVIDPPDALRRETLFRNRAYVFSRYGLWHILAGDVLRYGAFYLLRSSPDFRGLSEWLRASWAGLCGRLGRPESLS